MSFLKDLQREHRERAQPKSRQRLGLLEKKKDYKLRANDFKKKQTVLKRLREKAANRNPDEFYFKMIKSKTTGGVHTRSRRGKKLTQKQVVKMKTEDMMYYVTARQAERKKIERLQSTLHLLEPGARANKHTVFVDSFDQALTFSPENYFNTLPELVDRSFNRPTLEQLQSEEVFATSQQPAAASSISKTRKRQYTELKQRMQRERSLAKIVEKVSSKRTVMMSKGAAIKKMKVEDDRGNVKTLFKWKKVRSK